MAKLALVVLLALSLYSAGEAKESKKVLCYYNNWTTYRNGDCSYKKNHEGVEAKYCTHLIYNFADLDEEGNIKPSDPYSDLEVGYGKAGYQKINALKDGNDKLKTLLNVGSARDVIPFTKVSADEKIRKTFALNLVSYLMYNGFDGAIIEWPLPTADDKENFAALLKVVREKMDEEEMIMGVAVPGYETQMVGFDVEALNLADFVVVDSYFYRDVWSYGVFHPSPLYKCEGDNYGAADMDTVASAVGMVANQGVDLDKIIVAAYGNGRSFTLKDAAKDAIIGSPASYGKVARCSLEGGVINYDEGCDDSWKAVQIDSCKMTLRVKDDQVAAMESPESITAKSEFAKKYGGIMLRNGMDGDDWDGSCGTKQELLSIMYKTLVEE